MKDFRRLRVWGRAHQLALEVYRSSAEFPKHELYGLTSQMRRAAMSIPANIAEGCGREGNAELGRFLQIAMGSASELEYHLLFAHDLGLLAEGIYGRLQVQVVELRRMLNSLIQKVATDRRSMAANG